MSITKTEWGVLHLSVNHVYGAINRDEARRQAKADRKGGSDVRVVRREVTVTEWVKG